jgi:cytochrome P450
MLIAAQSGEDGGMSDQELHDQIATLFFGAYDTTSGTLHFLLNYLARYPDEQESLRRHLRARFATRADLARAPLADVEAVAPLCHFVDEVNRLHAIAPFFARTALRDVEVAGRLVPAGANFLIDSATVGRDPALWDGQADLDRFRPARWAGRRAGPLASPMPFGFGGRICPGRKIAMAEMRAFVAAVLLSHRVALRDPAEPLSFDMLIGLNLTAGNGNIRFDPA